MGYGSVTLWTPGRDFGIVALTNQAHRGNTVINMIALRAFEEYFGIEHVDWEARCAHSQFTFFLKLALNDWINALCCRIAEHSLVRTCGRLDLLNLQRW